MIRTIAVTTPSTARVADGAERFPTQCAMGCVLLAKGSVAAPAVQPVAGAEKSRAFLAAQRTVAATDRTAYLAAVFVAATHRLPTGRTGGQTIGAIGAAIRRIEGGKGRADQTLTMGAGHNAVCTIALAAGAARSQMAAVLLTAGAAYRTIPADQLPRYPVHPQMGAALAYPTG